MTADEPKAVFEYRGFRYSAQEGCGLLLHIGTKTWTAENGDHGAIYRAIDRIIEDGSAAKAEAWLGHDMDQLERVLFEFFERQGLFEGNKRRQVDSAYALAHTVRSRVYVSESKTPVGGEEER